MSKGSVEKEKFTTKLRHENTDFRAIIKNQ